MTTVLIILLGLLGVAATGYFLSWLTGPSAYSERRQQDPQNYPLPTQILYQPALPVEERPASRASLWPMLFLAAIAAVAYLAIKGAPAEKAGRTWLRSTTSSPSEQEPARVDYPSSAGPVYNPPDDRRQAYAESPSRNNYTPATREDTSSSQDYSGKTDTAPNERSTTPTYSRGYAVQIFAREKDWWDEAHLQRIQQEYPGEQLLTSSGYISGQVKVTKFLLGIFQDKAEADNFARLVSKEFPGAFTADLSKMGQVERYWPYP